MQKASKHERMLLLISSLPSPSVKEKEDAAFWGSSLLCTSTNFKMKRRVTLIRLMTMRLSATSSFHPSTMLLLQSAFTYLLILKEMTQGHHCLDFYGLIALARGKTRNEQGKRFAIENSPSKQAADSG